MFKVLEHFFVVQQIDQILQLYVIPSVSYYGEFQSDCICGSWITDWPNLYNIHTCKISTCGGRIIYSYSMHFCLTRPRNLLPEVFLRIYLL